MDELPTMPQKIREYEDRGELLAKLRAKRALWDRTARENKERADAFADAAQDIEAGATEVTIGRTTYRLA